MLSDAFNRVNALTQDQRDAAYENSRRRIAGRMPRQEDFAGQRYQKYPAVMLSLINLAGSFMLVAAFVPSAIRLFHAGVAATSSYTNDLLTAHVIGAMSVLLAETGQVALTLWASTIAPHQRALRCALYLGAGCCTVFAYVGNVAVVASPVPGVPPPEGAKLVLLAFEIFLPPTLVLIAANVLKAQLLHVVEERHAAQLRFDEAMTSWQQKHDLAERDPRWERVLATSLRDAIRDANKVSKAVLRELTLEDWRALVQREIKADEWWLDEAVSVRRRPDTRTVSAPQTADSSDSTDTQTTGHLSASAVADWLRTHEADADLSVRALAAKLGTTRHAAVRGKTLYAQNGVHA